MRKDQEPHHETMTEQVFGGRTPISEVIGDDIVRVGPDANLVEVAELLAGANIGAVVVGDQEKVIAVVSERDIVHAVAEQHDPITTKALEIGHTNLIWCDASATVTEVAIEMMDRYVRHVLVEDNAKLVGIVSARDLLGVYAFSEEDTS